MLEIINEAKILIQGECEPEKAEAITSYLALVHDRCVDMYARLSVWHCSRISSEKASTQHTLNLMWNYPEISGERRLWESSSVGVVGDYAKAL